MIAEVDVMSDGSVKITRKVSVEYVFANYTDGDGVGWAEEFNWLECNHAYQLIRLARLTQQCGLPSPPDERITLGNDGRVWDGHHRLYVAVLLGIDEVEVDQWIAGSSLDGSGSSEV